MHQLLEFGALGHKVPFFFAGTGPSVYFLFQNNSCFSHFIFN